MPNYYFVSTQIETIHKETLPVMTKEAFFAALREELLRYEWARNDPKRLDEFIDAARMAAHREKWTIPIIGKSRIRAWQRIGGTGQPTYLDLYRLPERSLPP
jgi:hypothetical protein